MIILDIDMPKNCKECPLVSGYDTGDCCCLDAWDGIRPDEGRHERCPIVGEIPKEHGRLIDADKFKEKYPTGNLTLNNALNRIIDAEPTIIEADRGKENE